MTTVHTTLLCMLIMTDRHHCFKSSNIPRPKGGQILPQLCDSLMIYMKPYWHKMRLCWSKSILHGACPCLPLTTVFRHVAFPRLSPLPQKGRIMMMMIMLVSCSAGLNHKTTAVAKTLSKISTQELVVQNNLSNKALNTYRFSSYPFPLKK